MPCVVLQPIRAPIQSLVRSCIHAPNEVKYLRKLAAGVIVSTTGVSLVEAAATRTHGMRRSAALQVCGCMWLGLLVLDRAAAIDAAMDVQTTENDAMVVFSCYSNDHK